MRRRVSTVVIVGALLTMPAGAEQVQLLASSSAQAAAVAARRCSLPPRAGAYFGLMAKGVSCSTARRVQWRWVRKQPGGSPEQVVKVGRFRCRGASVGVEDFVIRCKRKRPRATVTFGGGG